MAKKKDFTGGVFDNFIEAAAEERTITKAPKETTDKDNVYKFSARFPEEMGKYLMEKKWITRTSITDILIELVAEDMKKHPEIVESIDNLND